MRINYKPLTEHLNRLLIDGNQEWLTSYSEIESILKNKLPNSATNHRTFWSNTNKGPSRAWFSVGWKTSKVDMVGKTLMFKFIGEELLAKKSPNKMPMNKPASRDGHTAEPAPMVSVDVATKQDIKTLGDDIISKMNTHKNEMDIQKSEMDSEHMELKQSFLKYLIVASVCVVVAIALLDYI